MTSLHFWIILGDERVRKGSVIRSLTGLSREGYCDVALQNGQRLRLWTAITSANEGNVMTPDDWVKDCGPQPGYAHVAPARLNILAAFRFEAPPAPPARDYLNAIAAGGGIIESIVTLGRLTPAWVPSYGAPYGHVLDIRDPIAEGNPPAPDDRGEAQAPTNEIAARVRELWGWR